MLLGEKSTQIKINPTETIHSANQISSDLQKRNKPKQESNRRGKDTVELSSLKKTTPQPPVIQPKSNADEASHDAPPTRHERIDILAR